MSMYITPDPVPEWFRVINRIFGPLEVNFKKSFLAHTNVYEKDVLVRWIYFRCPMFHVRWGSNTKRALICWNLNKSAICHEMGTRNGFSESKKTCLRDLCKKIIFQIHFQTHRKISSVRAVAKYTRILDWYIHKLGKIFWKIFLVRFLRFLRCRYRSIRNTSRPDGNITVFDRFFLWFRKSNAKGTRRPSIFFFWILLYCEHNILHK